MTKLEELVYSLVAVLVRYHDSQSTQPIIVENDQHLRRHEYHAYAIELLTQDNRTVYSKLDGLIKAATTGYPGRSPFLHFILHETLFLKEQLYRTTPYNSSELETYKQQVYQLLLDFRVLLNTKKGTNCKVIFSQSKEQAKSVIDLSGLLNNAYVGNKYCNSGIFLKEEVMDRLHIITSFPNEELDEKFKEKILDSLKQMAISLCMEHQNALLIDEYEQQKISLNAKIYEQQITIESQREDLEKKNPALEAQSVEQAATIKSLSEELEKARLAVSNLEKKITIIESQNAEQKTTIKSQSDELEKSRLMIRDLEKKNAPMKDQNSIQQTAQQLLDPNLNRPKPGIMSTYSLPLLGGQGSMFSQLSNPARPSTQGFFARPQLNAKQQVPSQTDKSTPQSYIAAEETFGFN